MVEAESERICSKHFVNSFQVIERPIYICYPSGVFVDPGFVSLFNMTSKGFSVFQEPFHHVIKAEPVRVCSKYFLYKLQIIELVSRMPTIAALENVGGGRNIVWQASGVNERTSLTPLGRFIHIYCSVSSISRYRAKTLVLTRVCELRGWVYYKYRMACCLRFPSSSPQPHCSLSAVYQVPTSVLGAAHKLAKVVFVEDQPESVAL